MASVVFQDGVILTAAQLNAAMDQKADKQNPQFTGYVTLPSGPSAARPTAPGQFTLRGNSETGAPEVYIGNAWVSLSFGNQGNAPSPPTSLIAGAVSTSAIPISWAASTGPGTIKYQVQYQINGATSWTNWGGPGSATSATITSLQANTRYNIQVLAQNQYGSTASATLSVLTKAVAPNAPTNPAISAITSQSLAISWNGSTVGTSPVAYLVSYKKSTDSAYTDFGSAISGTTEVITGLDPATAYFLHVTAQNAGGTAVSVDVSGTTLSAAGVSPNAPTGLTASAIGQNSFNLAWTASSAGDAPISYRVYGRTGSNAYVPLGSGTTGTSKSITGLNPGVAYSIYVVASNSAGSAQSNSITVTTSAVTPGTTGQTWGQQYSSLVAPILNGPVAGQVATSGTIPIQNLGVNDPPASSAPGNCTLTISCNRTGGTLSSTDANGNPVSGSGTNTINGYAGTLSSISTVLQNLIYSAPASAMTDTITIQFTDQAANTTQLSVKMTVVTGAAPTLPWGQSSLAGPGNIATDSTGTTALRVQDILGRVGVATELDNNPSPYFGNLSQVENAINYIGVSTIRDTLDPSNSSNTTWLPQIKANVQVIGGLKYWLYIATEVQADFQPQLDLYTQMAASGYVVTIEGENSADFSSEGVQPAIDYQPTLYTAAHNKGVSAATFSLSVGAAAVSGVPSQASVSDYGTIGFGPVDAPFDSSFSSYYNQAVAITPGKPAVLNSFGWQSFPEGGSATGQQGFASENAVAAYMLDTIFDAVLLGFKWFFWAGLVDNPNDFDGATTYGLFDNSWNPKPAGTALRNTNLLMMDQGTNATSFTPGKLAYGLNVTPAGVDQLGLHTLLLQRSDGAFFLVLWNEQILQDLSNYPNQTNAEITVSPISVNLTLTTSATKIAVYDPMVGTSPVQTGSGTAISVSVPAHPIYVEIVRP